MKKKACVLLFCLLVIQAENECDYNIVAPNRLKLGRDVTFYVNYQCNQISTKFNFNISIVAINSDKNQPLEPEILPIATKQFERNSGEHQELTMKVSKGNIGERSLYLSIERENSTEKKMISEIKEHMTLFVQTDKHFYKPGQTVKYRVISFDEDFKPYTKPFNITVHNSRSNLVVQRLMAQSEYGVLIGEVKLHAFAMLGDWKLTVESELEAGTAAFSVLANDLPPQEAFNIKTDFENNAGYTIWKPLQSKHNKIIDLKLENRHGFIKAGKYLNFILESSEPLTTFSYKLFRSYVIVHSKTVVEESSKKHHFSIMISPTMALLLAPTAKILVYYTSSDGELVADAMEIQVDEYFTNSVSLKFSATTVLPSSEVSLKIQASKGSYVGYFAIDQSALQMGVDDLFWQEEAEEQLKWKFIKRLSRKKPSVRVEEINGDDDGMEMGGKNLFPIHNNASSTDALFRLVRSVKQKKTETDLSLTTIFEDDKLKLNVKCSWMGEGDSGVVILEVKKLTSFILHESQLMEYLQGQVQKIVVADDVIHIYFNQLTLDGQRFFITFDKPSSVYNISPAPVYLYTQSHPDLRSTQYYLGDSS